MIFVLVVVVLTVAADQLTKYIMAGLLPGLEGRSLPVIENVLHFTYVENEGAAFGMLAEHRWVFMVLSVIGLAAIAFIVMKEKPASRWVRLAAGLVLGGGIGNMIDRLGFGFAEKSGAVLDFIDCRFVDFYVFNVADSCVTVGCFLYLFLIVVGEIRAAKEKKEAAVPEIADAADDDTAADPEEPDGTGETPEDTGVTEEEEGAEEKAEEKTESQPEEDAHA